MISDGKIKAPVSMADIHNVLNESSYELGVLCQSARINKWARYKPVRHASTGRLTAAQLRSTNYGLYNAALDNNVTNPITDCGRLLTPWDYLKPRGNTNPKEPYRLTDFVNAGYVAGSSLQVEGYNHKATAPIAPLGDKVMRDNETITFYFSRQGIYNGVTDLALTDFVSLDDRYPCVIIIGEATNGNKWMAYKTASAKFSEEGTRSVAFNKTDLPQLTNNKTCAYYMCAASHAQATVRYAVQGGHNFVPLPSDGNLTGSLLYTNQLGLAWHAIGIKSTSTLSGGAQIFYPISDYQFVQVGGTANNLPVKSANGSVAILYEVTNNRTDALTITKGMFSGAISKTFASNSSVNVGMPSTMLVSSTAPTINTLGGKAQYSFFSMMEYSNNNFGFTLSAGQSAYIALQFPNALRLNSSGTLQNITTASPIYTTLTITHTSTGSDQATSSASFNAAWE